MRKPSFRTGATASLGFIAIAAGVIGGTNILANDDGKDGYGEILAYATGEQAVALEDGEVTREEYDRAFAAQIACFDAAGVPYHEPTFDDEQQRWVAHIGPIVPGTVEETMADYEACFTEHYMFVATAWSAQLGQTGTIHEEHQ